MSAFALPQVCWLSDRVEVLLAVGWYTLLPSRFPWLSAFALPVLGLSTSTASRFDYPSGSIKSISNSRPRVKTFRHLADWHMLPIRTTRPGVRCLHAACAY